MKWPSFFISRLAASHHFFQSSADDVGHEHCLDLVRRGFAVVAVEDQLDQIQVVRGQLAHALRDRRLCARGYGLWGSA